MSKARGEGMHERLGHARRRAWRGDRRILTIMLFITSRTRKKSDIDLRYSVLACSIGGEVDIVY